MPTASPTMRLAFDVLEPEEAGAEGLEDVLFAARVCDAEFCAEVVLEVEGIVPSSSESLMIPKKSPGMKLKTFSLSVQHDASVWAQQ